MFNRFPENSHKIINVEATLFELIAGYNQRVIIVPKEQSNTLNHNSIFGISCGDAVIICETIGAYDSDVDRSFDIIEFEIKDA
ncbi:hypothetical protein [Gilliamella mensalis]|uniref:hypothetical protein n=1 Tax=Gilliamella mensalis TaxID=1908520 RepID=UPI00117A06E6|nr:hypothetical protein [Gilliamella mensalis]